MIQRERFEEYQKHIYLGRTLMLLLGSDVKHVPQLARAEELLELAIFQTAYDLTSIRQQMETARNAAMAARNERLRDAELLAKVASYGEPDETEADAFKVVLSKTRLHGVENPWE